ncbi:MAG TPA: class I SAM-dependent methyltransferase [Nitratidesulfovibrio sp.]|nr:class I SAM-dependent methyltransferase [Nitratidesulfovibrio sp.]
MDERERQKRFHIAADAPRLHNRLRNPWIVAREQRLAKRLAAFCRPGSRVLEVGCGEGSNLAYLADACPNARLFGLDFSDAKVTFSAARRPDFAHVCGDAQSLPFDDRTFDFVFCRDLLHHVDFNRSGVLAEMLRVLAPGGTALILEAQGNTILNRLFRLLYPAERGLAHSSADTLLSLAKGHGAVSLEPVEASFLTRALGFVLGWPEGVLHLPLHCAYATSEAWERVLQRWLPRRHWTYLCLTITPNGLPQTTP